MFEKITSLGESYFAYAKTFFAYPINPNERLFIIYLLTSLLFAYVLYRERESNESFKDFLFPNAVWNHPSAWLDLRYFFFHGLIGHFVVYILVAGAFISGLSLTMSFEAFQSFKAAAPPDSFYRWIIAGIAVIALTAITDFFAFLLHYMQHKVPLFWQFHKVHHSGEVMHPLTNFREHPVDNLTYDFILKFIHGAALGLIMIFLGFIPDAMTILGVGVFSVAFNIAGYQLRHSHIWLRWPGNWSKVFPSPAHHHVHHSRHPEHLDKNFAFMFPIWDVLFKTYEMPEDNRNVEFGIVEDSSELNSCINLYLIPFRDAYRILRKTTPKDKATAIATSPPA